MTQLHPNMPIHLRVTLIAEALAKVLDRGPEMSVETSGRAGEHVLSVYVIKDLISDGARIGHEIDTIARELEVLL